MSGKLMSVAFAVATVVGMSSAQANLIAYEGFDGANQIGFQNAFPVAGGTMTSPSLTYGSLATEGGSRQGGDAGTGAYNLLSSPVTSGTVWMSWLYKTAPTPAVWNRLKTFTGINPYDDGAIHRERYNLGYIDSWFGIRGTWGAGAHPSGVWNAPQLGDTTYMFVAKYEFGDAGVEDGKITLWVSPDTSSLGTGLAPTGGHEIIAQNISDDSMGFTGISFEAANSQFDEFRLGDSWASVSPVVPEPGALAMLAGSALLALRRRSR